MASWRDNYRPASYKGVPFEVLGDELPFGRRNVEHEYPLRDEADGEDLGKKNRRYSFEAVIKPGADFMARRDALIAVVEGDPTPGFLIHPYYGQKYVQPGPCTVTHHASEGGWCRLRLEFAEVAQGKTQPAQSIDTTFVALSAVDDLNSQAQTDLVAGLSIEGQPAFVATAATSLIGQAQAAISGAAATLTGFGQPLDSFVAQALAIKGNLLGLATAPLVLGAQLSTLLQGLSQIAATPQALLGVLQPLLSFGADLLPIDTSTAARTQQAANQHALVNFVQRSAAACAVQAVANTTFASYEEATTARDALDDTMDTLSIAAADAFEDDAFAVLEAARQAMIADVTARGGSLQHLYSFTPAGTVPALLLASRLFVDIANLEDNFADIVARNGIVNPGFVPGGRALEVLTDG
jgi:prophage DNA circulation protein